MKQSNTLLLLISLALAAFLAGRWSNSDRTVRADSGGSPQVELRPIGGDTNLTVYYPNLNKLFVYQSPFAGLPKTNCSYTVQLGEPGGRIERKPCSNPGQVF